MVTFLYANEVVPLLRVAVKVTFWLTAGVGLLTKIVEMVAAPLPTLMLRTLLVDDKYALSPAKVA